MAVLAARDLLSLTSALLDNSDEIWDETRRVAKHAESRKVFSDVADLRIAIHSQNLDGAYKQLFGPGAPTGHSLNAAVKDAQSAASSFTALHSARESVVEARQEALLTKDAEIAQRHEAMRADMTAKKLAIDGEFNSTLRPLASVYSN